MHSESERREDNEDEKMEGFECSRRRWERGEVALVTGLNQVKNEVWV